MICPSQKKVFGTESSALAFAQSFSKKKRSHKRKLAPLYPYRCPLCPFWHLTTAERLSYNPRYEHYKEKERKKLLKRFATLLKNYSILITPST